MHSLLSGPKFNNRHQTYVPGAADTIRALKLAPCISKIMLGEIAPARPGLRRCKLRSIQVNLIELMYRDVNAVQIIRVNASDVSEAMVLIAKLIKDRKKKPDTSKSKARSNCTANNKKASKTRQVPSVKSPAYVPEALGTFFPPMEGLQLKEAPPPEEVSAERMAIVNAKTFPIIDGSSRASCTTHTSKLTRATARYNGVGTNYGFIDCRTSKECVSQRR